VFDGTQTATRYGDPRDLLPMTSARPRDALAGARAVLAAGPGPLDASIAHHVIGIVLREFGDTSAGLTEFRRALHLARRSGARDREADILASQGVALIQIGRTRPGLSAMNTALGLAEGAAAARIAFLRGGALWVLGRYDDALDDLRRAVPALRAAGDALWTARALTLRALIHLGYGSIDRAEPDLLEAERLFAGIDQELDSAYATHNRALVAFRSGDLPAALARLHDADRRYRSLGTPSAELVIDRCGVLLAAGLAHDALAEADAAVRRVEALRGQSTRKAELLLVAARSALAAGDPASAVDRATRASRLFTAQRREWWRTHSRLVVLQARFATGAISGRLLGEAARTADRLTRLRSAEAVPAHLLAGRTALALGRAKDADRHLAAAARTRHRGPLLARVAGWLAEALNAQAKGQPGRMLTACRRGLDVLDEHRLGLGASELRAQATAHGAELAAMAQRECAGSGQARRLLVWAERWRATSLQVPPVRPPDDDELRTDLTALREVTSRLEKAQADGTAVPALRRDRSRLETRIRARAMHAPGPGRSGHQRFGHHRFDVDALLEECRELRLIEIMEIDGDLRLLVCGQGRVREFASGRAVAVNREVDFALSSVRRLAYPSPGGEQAGEQALRLLGETGRLIEGELFGRALRYLGDGPVVIVPPGRLHAVPWAVLPALASRPVSVAPSAAAWLRARRAAPPDGGVVLVRGPDLRTGGAEVPALAAVYPHATVLENGTATVQRVLDAIDGSRLAHIAAHGTFRADSPLFSSLRLDDGPLTVHDFERLKRAPYRLVLPSCDSARLAPVGADELLGLTAALLPLGTVEIVASVVPVNDAATVALMLALHRGLRCGQTMAEALLSARGDLYGDPVQRATALSFVALGAG
jgi:tetratricopeptide (TPR) repeat protein